MTLIGRASTPSDPAADSAAQALQSIFNDGCDPVRLFGRIEPFVLKPDNFDQWIAAIRREYPFRVTASEAADRLVVAMETASQALGQTPYQILSAVSDHVADARDIQEWVKAVRAYVRGVAERN